MDVRISAGGAIASAAGAAASWLCCLPFALGILGSAGSGLAHFLGPLRPYITLLSVGLLGLAFFQAYRGSGGSCERESGCGRPANASRRRLFLWIVAALSGILITVPYWLSWVIYWNL